MFLEISGPKVETRNFQGFQEFILTVTKGKFYGFFMALQFNTTIKQEIVDCRAFYKIIFLLPLKNRMEQSSTNTPTNDPARI